MHSKRRSWHFLSKGPFSDGSLSRLRAANASCRGTKYQLPSSIQTISAIWLSFRTTEAIQALTKCQTLLVNLGGHLLWRRWSCRPRPKKIDNRPKKLRSCRLYPLCCLGWYSRFNHLLSKTCTTFMKYACSHRAKLHGILKKIGKQG